MCPYTPSGLFLPVCNAFNHLSCFASSPACPQPLVPYPNKLARATECPQWCKKVYGKNFKVVTPSTSFEFQCLSSSQKVSAWTGLLASPNRLYIGGKNITVRSFGRAAPPDQQFRNVAGVFWQKGFATESGEGTYNVYFREDNSLVATLPRSDFKLQCVCQPGMCIETCCSLVILILYSPFRFNFSFFLFLLLFAFSCRSG